MGSQGAALATPQDLLPPPRVGPVLVIILINVSARERKTPYSRGVEFQASWAGLLQVLDITLGQHT